ncbi:MerR family transcriptional regulator [Sandarakinorhabdus sp.]|uniref:MerR family transcriptional regulator n=1 Tax=Sandarakinorhabdus sp. TaxID=1916663 RepID=UPI003342C2E4
MAEKSETAFRTISEAADDIGLPAHVLRFWETRFAQLQPMKRAGGRRYYRQADMALLRQIKALLQDQGMTIRGAQMIIASKASTPDATQAATLVPIDRGALLAIRNRLACALAA